LGYARVCSVEFIASSGRANPTYEDAPHAAVRSRRGRPQAAGRVQNRVDVGGIERFLQETGRSGGAGAGGENPTETKSSLICVVPKRRIAPKNGDRGPKKPAGPLSRIGSTTR
jgi:hypothetical protein